MTVQKMDDKKKFHREKRLRAWRPFLLSAERYRCDLIPGPGSDN